MEGVVLNPCGPRRGQPAAVAEGAGGGVERESPAGRASAIRVRASRVSEGWKWAGAQRPGRRGAGASVLHGPACRQGPTLLRMSGSTQSKQSKMCCGSQ